MEKLLDANYYDYDELRNLELFATILIDNNFGKCTIEEVLKNIKKVLETYWQTPKGMI